MKLKNQKLCITALFSLVAMLSLWGMPHLTPAVAVSLLVFSALEIGIVVAIGLSTNSEKIKRNWKSVMIIIAVFLFLNSFFGGILNHLVLKGEFFSDQNLGVIFRFLIWNAVALIALFFLSLPTFKYFEQKEVEEVEKETNRVHNEAISFFVQEIKKRMNPDFARGAALFKLKVDLRGIPEGPHSVLSSMHEDYLEKQIYLAFLNSYWNAPEEIWRPVVFLRNEKGELESFYFDETLSKTYQIDIMGRAFVDKTKERIVIESSLKIPVSELFSEMLVEAFARYGYVCCTRIPFARKGDETGFYYGQDIIFVKSDKIK